MTVPNIPEGLRGADMDVKITRDTLKAGIKGEPPAVEGKLRYKVTWLFCLCSLTHSLAHALALLSVI